MGKAGEAVLARLALEHPAVRLLGLAQGALRLDLAGQVLELGDDVEEPALLVPHRGHVDQHRHRRAVAADVPLADLVAVERAVDELGEQGQVLLAVVGVGDVADAQPDELLRRVAHHPAEGRVDLEEAPIGRHQAHPDRRFVERGPEQLGDRIQASTPAGWKRGPGSRRGGG